MLRSVKVIAILLLIMVGTALVASGFLNALIDSMFIEVNTNNGMY